MAINIFCGKCYTSNGLDAKQCSKCGIPFTRDRKYRVCASVKGKRVTRVVDNLTIAREIEAALKGDLLRDEFNIADHRVKEVVTLDDFFETHFLPWAKEHKGTWKNDQYLYDAHLKPLFGNRSLEDITGFEIEKMKLTLKKSQSKHGRPFTPATIKHIIVLLKRLFNLAIRWRIHKGDNPCSSVEMPKLDNQVTEFLTDEETKRLLSVLDSWPSMDSAAFVKFALFTGIRRGEIFKLKWSDVDFERARITLQDPKGKKTQTVPVSEQALSVIANLSRTSEYVFPGVSGKKRVDFKFPWYRIREVAGLPENFRFCGLQHNFASSLVSNGIDLYAVGRLLTHKQVSTTSRYAHLSDEAMRKAAQKSGELLQGKNQPK